MSQLLLEYFPVEYNVGAINESIKHNAPVKIKALLQKADTKNENGRVYPKDILLRESEKYNTDYVKTRSAVGSLDHPDSPVVELATASHLISEMHWEGDSLMGILEILTTPSGNIAKELLRCGVRVGISSRGVGSIRKISEGIDEVEDDYKLLAFDLVSNPSTPGAYLYEGKTVKINEKNKILNELISEFLCEVGSSCQI